MVTSRNMLEPASAASDRVASRLDPHSTFLCSFATCEENPQRAQKIEVRDSRAGYCISFLHAMGQGSGQMEELLGRRRRRRLGAQDDIQARKL